MLSLQQTIPKVHEAFHSGQFAVQMGNVNPFGQNEADKTIKNTINKDCKSSGGYIGFSHNFAATQSNLIPRLFPLVEERPWLGLVTCHTDFVW